MNNANFSFHIPENEPIKTYLPGSEERIQLQKAIAELSSQTLEIPLIINGKPIKTDKMASVRMPHQHNHVLANNYLAGEKEIKIAIDAALKAKNDWLSLSWLERASITLKAAELISKKYRYLLNAATMLGQGKNIFQAEIDAASETIDFLRYNAYFAFQIY